MPTNFTTEKITNAKNIVQKIANNNDNNNELKSNENNSIEQTINTKDQKQFDFNLIQQFSSKIGLYKKNFMH